MSDTETIDEEEVEVDEAPVSDSTSPDDAVEVPDAGDLTHVVLRPFHGGGVDRHAGEVVAGSGWRSADRLVDMRYLRVLTIEDEKPITDGDGRFFINDDALLNFIESTEEDEA